MRNTGTLDRIKERLLFAVALCAACAYAALWVSEGGAASGAAVSPSGGQRFVLAAGVDDPLPEPEAVFAAGDKEAYYDETVPPRWVQPRVVVDTREPVTLDLPVSTFPAPPGLLPIPGPAVENSSAVPRWPAFAPAATEE